MTCELSLEGDQNFERRVGEHFRKDILVEGRRVWPSESARLIQEGRASSMELEVRGGGSDGRASWKGGFLKAFGAGPRSLGCEGCVSWFW